MGRCLRLAPTQRASRLLSAAVAPSSPPRAAHCTAANLLRSIIPPTKTDQVDGDSLAKALDVALRESEKPARAMQLLKSLREHLPLPEDIMTSANIVDGDPDWNYTLLAYLMLFHCEKRFKTLI